MKIILLTHERELERPSNTGAVALSVAGGHDGLVVRSVWSRVAPDQDLVNLLTCGEACLVYPKSEVECAEASIEEGLEACEHFVLLDATWQEARKMYNRSPYLKAAQRISLTPSAVSRFVLRRNQKSDGLCTAECVIEILRSKGHTDLAARIQARFDLFNTR